MLVLVKLSTTLRACVPGYDAVKGIEVGLSAPATAGDLARRLGLPFEQIKIIMVNGKHGDLESPLADGDRVSYFPAVGGG